MRRTFAFSLAAGLLLVVSSVLAACPRDKAATKKIKEAIEVHFLNTDFDQAEGLLLGTIRACEDKCCPDVLAKAWMYVGVVRGAGRNDIGGATEAFKTAISTDAGVELDADVATDPVKQAWAKAKGTSGPKGAEPAPGGEAPSGGMKCSPTPTEIETRRPFPMECESDGDLASAKIHYKPVGGGWESEPMQMEDGVWRGTIPCTAFGNTGSLKYYVEGVDADQEVAASLGTKSEPQSVDVATETTADPPAFPGQEPPARCNIEDMPAPGKGGGAGGGGGACGAWGAPCGEDNCCNEGLACINGTCESAQCKEDSDCEGGGECVDGRCETEDKAAGPGAKNWISLQLGYDIASVSSDNACSGEARENDHFACYYGNGEHPQEPNPNAAGSITGGFAPATIRVLATYERLFGPIGAEVRLGFAFNGGRTPEDGSAFFPIHAEVRGKFWILGEKAFGKPGIRPWVHLGGGLAQVDVTVPVEIIDCSSAPDPTACRQAGSVVEARARGGTTGKPVATKQLGNSFAAAGGGVLYAIGKNHGPLLNVNFMIPFPSSGLVVEPSLGYGVGF